jgi:hypothetical protein
MSNSAQTKKQEVEIELKNKSQAPVKIDDIQLDFAHD